MSLIINPYRYAGLVFPLDLVPGAEFVFSAARRLTAISWGTVDTVLDPIRRLFEDGGSSEETFAATGAGDLDVAAIATFLAGAVGSDSKLYDQTGFGHHHTQTDTAQQPLYDAAGLGGRPAMVFDGLASYLDLVTPTSTSGDFTILVVANVDATPTFDTLVAGNDASDRMFGLQSTTSYDFRPTSPSVEVPLTATISAGTTHLFALRRSSNNLRGYLDGVNVTSGSPTESTAVGWGGIGARKGGGGARFPGVIGEGYYYRSALSDAALTLLSDNIIAYWI